MKEYKETKRQVDFYLNEKTHLPITQLLLVSQHLRIFELHLVRLKLLNLTQRFVVCQNDHSQDQICQVEIKLDQVSLRCM